MGRHSIPKVVTLESRHLHRIRVFAVARRSRRA